MSTHRFKVGDRVRLIHADSSDARMGLVEGSLGTVCVVDPPDDEPCIGVAWDHPAVGHTCRGHAPDGNGWYVFVTAIEPLPSLRVWAGRAVEEDEFATP